MPFHKPTRLLRLFTVLAPLAVLIGCGQGSGPQSIPGTPQPVLKGVLVDSEVSGVSWETSGGRAGVTGDSGEFEYTQLTTGNFQDLVTFSIGDIVLGTVPGRAYVTAVELTSSFSPVDRAALNQLVFLQSIDADSNPSNGITISEATQAAAIGQELDFDSPDFATEVGAVVNTIAPGNAVVTETAALDHFYTTYAELGGTDTFDFLFPGYPPVGEDAAEFALTFADEFDSGDAPDPAKWNIDQGYGPDNFGWGNNEWQLYTDSPDNLRVEDGNLVITALCPVEPCGVRDGTITSGRITTLDKFNFKYGKVVARIKMPVGEGTWPAFWSLGANFPDVGWPRSGEIDFVEVFNNTYNSAAESVVAQKTTTSAMHWCDEIRVPDPQANCFPAGRIFVTEKLEWPDRLDEDFHIWESNWTADRVTVSIDGVQYFELEIDPQLMEEFRREFFLLLNVAMGGTLGSGGEPPQGDETFPQTMLVDFVRVYQRVDDISPPELTAVTIASNNANPGFATTGDVVTVTLTSDESILAPTVSIGGTAATNVVGSGTDWQASRALTADDADGVIPFTIEYVDVAGNEGFPVSTSTDSSRVTVDGTAPSLTAVTIASNNDNPGLATIGDIVEVTLTADEPIATPTVTIGGIATTPVGSGPNWRASRAVTAGDTEGVVDFSITYADSAGNAGAPVSESTDSSSVLVNINSATVAIAGAPATFNSLTAIPVSFEFSKPVTGFELGDIQTTNGAAGGFVAVDADTYTAAVTPTGLGDLVIAVPAGAAIDAAGTPTVAAADVVVTRALNPDAPLLNFVGIASSNPNGAFARAGDLITLTLTASEAISTPTVTIAGAQATVTGSGDSYQATRVALVSDPEGPVAFTVDNFEAVDDLTPGFESTATTDGSAVTFDVTRPTLTIVGLPAVIEFLEPLAVTFQFSEAVNGFDVGEVAVTNGALSTFSIVDAATYTADITPDAVGDLSVAVAADVATDAAGNGNLDAAETSVVDSAWRLIWSDEFNNGLNPLRWTARTNADCPEPCDGVQTYLGERVAVANGRLTIEARNNGGFTSGLIDTRGNLEFTFGRIEIDARMPGTQGTLPSLRLLPAIPPGEAVPNYGPFPQSGEIDVVNAPNLGPSNSTLEHTLRYGLPEPEDTVTTRTSTAPGAPTLDDIEYAIEWEGGEVRWFVNDIHVATQTQDNWYAYFEDADGDGDYDADGAYTLGMGAAPFDQDFYVAIGLAVGSDADSFFPQTLEIEAVRVYECANPVDPVAGTGCSTGTGVLPADAPDAPYTEMLEIYTDAPATLGFLEPEGTTSFATLNPFVFTEDPSVVVTSVINAPDGANTVWRADVQAPTGTFGSVIMSAQGSSAGASSRYFDLSGGGTAGEILFRLRVNSASAGARLEAGLVDRQANDGAVPLDFVADGQWRDYSVKITDVAAASVTNGTPLDLSDIFGVFFGGLDGAVNFDLDDIQIKVACRDVGGCEATPRTESSVPPIVVYTEDFESLDQGSSTALGFTGAGFGVFADIWDGEVDTGIFQYQYGVFTAPNGGPSFSAVGAGEGGPDQGSQYVTVYSDYNNQDHGNGLTINTSVLREWRPLSDPITADDIGKCWTFSGDYKAPFEDQDSIANPASNATAKVFFVTLDPNDIDANGRFAATNSESFDTTSASKTEWARFEVSIDLADPALIGQLLQFGFNTTATNFESSGVFYDNLKLTTRVGACPAP